MQEVWWHDELENLRVYDHRLWDVWAYDHLWDRHREEKSNKVSTLERWELEEGTWRENRERERDGRRRVRRARNPRSQSLRERGTGSADTGWGGAYEGGASSWGPVQDWWSTYRGRQIVTGLWGQAEPALTYIWYTFFTFLSVRPF